MKRFRPCGVYCNDDLVRADAGPSNPFRRTRSRRPAFRIDRTSPTPANGVHPGYLLTIC